ncbi:MAG: hypothetical protein JWQ56_1756 [Pseudarthrobacter sp.]|nr:hypothetical protein [Pseudarthrobacter sp.]
MDLLGEPLPDLGEHVVAELDQVKRVDRDRGAWKPHPQGLAERRRGVDGDDLHTQAPLKRPGEEPVSDAFTVAAVHDSQDLSGVQIDDGGHPGFVAFPSLGDWVAEEPHRPVAVLTNAEHPRCQGINIRQRQRCGIQSPLHQPPGDTERGGSLRRRPAGSNHGGYQGVPEPAGGPCPARNLGCFLGECPARAQVLIAEESSLGPHHFDRPGDRNVTQALGPAGMHAGADHPARRAAGLGSGSDVDPSLTECKNLGTGDAVVGQVEDGGGSIGARGSRLDQGS